MGIIQKITSIIALSLVGVFGGYIFLQKSDYLPETEVAIEIEDTIRLEGMRICNPYSFVLPITNISNDSVEIYHVETFCGCLESYYPKQLLPCTKDSIYFVFNPQLIGHLEQKVLIITDKSSEPIEVILMGFVKK